MNKFCYHLTNNIQYARILCRTANQIFRIFKNYINLLEGQQVHLEFQPLAMA